MDCSTVKHHADAYWHAPFWQDEFVLLVHPQFATWVLGDGIDRHVMLGAVPVTANITVGELAACATGVPLFGQNACVVQYSDNSIQTADGRAFVYVGDKHDLTIARRDAASLLALDPFYSHGQGAALATNRALPIQKVSYGSKIGQPTSLAFDLSVDNTKAQTSTSSATAAHSATITTVRGNSSSVGLSIATALVGEELTIDNKEQSTLEEAVSVSYTDSTATSTQVVTSAKVRLNDVDNTQLLDHGDTCKPCHDPLPDAPSATVYLDRVFGTFMYQDPGAPGAPSCRDGCNEVFVGGVLGALVGFYQAKDVFVDVERRRESARAARVLLPGRIVEADARHRSRAS